MSDDFSFFLGFAFLNFEENWRNKEKIEKSCR